MNLTERSPIGAGRRFALPSPVRPDARRRLLGHGGLAAQVRAEDGDRSELGRVGLARFCAEKLLPLSSGLARAVASGAEPLQPYEVILADSA